MSTLRSIFVLALAYLITGKLALMLALPPGYASAIFPPAGIALAALTSRGAHLIPGVGLGAFALNALTGFVPGAGLSTPALLAAAIVMVGSILQAWCGSRLLRRHVPLALDSGHAVLLFLLLAPLVCLISASISVAGLVLLEIVPADAATANWLTWWVGDTIGMLLAAPLTWIWLGEPRPLWRSRGWLLGLPLVFSSAIFITMYIKASGWEQEQRMLGFRLKSQQVGDMLQYEFGEHERLLYTMAKLLQQRHLIAPANFSSMARTYLDARPELRSLSWAPRISGAGRAAFEQWAQQNIAAGFAVRQFNPARSPTRSSTPLPPAADGQLYYPMAYVEPLAGNERAQGLDMLSEPTRATTINLAIARGHPTASAPLTLVSSDQPRTGILLAQAVGALSEATPQQPPQRGSAPDALQEAASGLTSEPQPAGMLLLVLQVEPYLQHALARSGFSGVVVKLVDVTTTAAPLTIVDRTGLAAQAGDSTRRLELGGRQYQISFAPTDADLEHQRGWQSWSALASGLLLIGLLGAFLLLMSGERMQIEATVADRTRKLHEREARLQAILDQAADAILTIDRDGIMVSVNGAAEHLFGYAPGRMQGLPFGLLLPPEDGACGGPMLDRLGQYSAPGSELVGCYIDGRRFPLAISVSRVALPDETVFVCILRDLTEQRRTQERIYQLAHHDPLTGLANRFTLNLRLEQLLALTRRSHASVAVLFLDLDHFKKINDSHGHQVGDLLLIEVARRLTELLRDADTVARLGGDEFIVLLTAHATLDGIAGVAQRIIGALGEPYLLDGQNLRTGASVGISLFPADGEDASTLLRHADTAMYVAKSRGRGQYQFFSAAMNASAHERLMMEDRLWQALEQQEFELYLQPQIHLASGRIIGAEALIRWHHPQLGMVRPDRFIPIAEECGLILPLGEWILAQAMHLLADWQRRQLPAWRLAVNLSARQCHADTLLTGVDRLLAETGIAPARLELEITETAAMQDPEQTRVLLQQLRARGITVAIDDFGTGYSSLNYLKLFAIDRIKIDRSFVHDIDTDQNGAVIVSATIALAHTLGLQVIAEGVETAAQCEFLRRQQCDEVQGYYYGRPMTVAEFEAFAAQYLGACRT